MSTASLPTSPVPVERRPPRSTGSMITGWLSAPMATRRAPVHGFLLAGKKYKTLDVPGALATIATGINNQGHIVLYWQDQMQNTESSLYNGKTYKTIDVPGASNTYAEDLDNADDVIYQWLDADLHPHGALLRGGAYYKFDHPAAMGTYGAGINDRRTVVGFYEPDNNYGGGFRAT